MAAFLPHRDPMMFVDEVTALSDNGISTRLYLDPDFPCFQGHFPGFPIFPGVLLTEATAQSGALLVSLTRGLSDGQFLGLAQVDSARFRDPVYPTETICVDVEIEKERRTLYKFRAQATRDEQPVAEVRFTAALMTF